MSNEPIQKLFDNLHKTLDQVESRLIKVKGNLESASKDTEATVRAKLEELKTQLESKKQEVEAAKSKLDERLETMKTETVEKVAEWKLNREQEKLETRAANAEDHAVAAIIFAIASLEQMDEAILEAIEARKAADEAIS